MRKIYAIRDRVAREIAGHRMYSLMTFRTNEEAARYFADAVNDTTSILNKHPHDYDLALCGEVDDDGKITPVEGTPVILVTGDTLLAVQQPALVKDA